MPDVDSACVVLCDRLGNTKSSRIAVLIPLLGLMRCTPYTVQYSESDV
jgi:hypothetical protein